MIIPWFGSFKKDFLFWLKSAEKNSTVDFFLLTDQEFSHSIPNLRVERMSFSVCRELFQNKFDFSVSLSPYKLCDFKPSYGYVLENYVKGYDFWGHCDVDLIFGNIRNFITDDILNRYDRILSRGHFTLYRNTPDVNQSFMKPVLSYRDVFTSVNVLHFDEHPGTGQYWFQHLPDRIYDKIIFDDLNWKTYQFIDVHKWNTIDKGRKYFIYSFENGRLFRCFHENDTVKREEIMYVHFQKRFMQVTTQVSDYFTIIPNKFIAYEESPGYDFLRKNVHNRFGYTFCHYVRIKFNSLKRRMTF